MSSISNVDVGIEMDVLTNPKVKNFGGSPEIHEDYEMTQQQLVKEKIAQIFSRIPVEQVEYNQTMLTNCGTSRGDDGDTAFRPFTGFDRTPHSYRSNLAVGAGEADSHKKLAAAIITKYGTKARSDSETTSESETTSDNEITADQWGTALQNLFNENNDLALRAAAMLIQVGDELNPLPRDLQCSLMDHGYQASFVPNQGEMIIFDDEGSITVISERLDIRYKDEIEEGEDEHRVIPGEFITQIEGQRTITIGMPDHEGNVVCTIARKYFFN